MQIGINLPSGKVMNDGPRGSGGQRSRSREAKVVWKPGGDIILDPSSRVDRGIQRATDVLPL